MANTSSAKGNPASHRMSNPNNKNRRIKNKVKNEQLRAKGIHPKQIRQKENEERHRANLELVAEHGFMKNKVLNKGKKNEKVIKVIDREAIRRYRKEMAAS